MFSSMHPTQLTQIKAGAPKQLMWNGLLNLNSMSPTTNQKREQPIGGKTDEKVHSTFAGKCNVHKLKAYQVRFYMSKTYTLLGSVAATQNSYCTSLTTFAGHKGYCALHKEINCQSISRFCICFRVTSPQ